MAQQTAVEWLQDVYNTQGHILPSQFEQAKQMERGQRIAAQMNMNDFSKGYACAVAQIIEQHGETTLAEDIFSCNFMSVETMKKIEIDEHDIELLKPIVKEIERKRSLAGN